MRAFIKAFPESGALGHEGIAEGYAAGYEQPARAKCGQRPVPAGPCVETGIPVQCSCFASERFGGDFVSSRRSPVRNRWSRRSPRPDSTSSPLKQASPDSCAAKSRNAASSLPMKGNMTCPPSAGRGSHEPWLSRTSEAVPSPVPAPMMPMGPPGRGQGTPSTQWALEPASVRHAQASAVKSLIIRQERMPYRSSASVRSTSRGAFVSRASADRRRGRPCRRRTRRRCGDADPGPSRRR